jgi:hypothetical protein
MSFCFCNEALYESNAVLVFFFKINSNKIVLQFCKHYPVFVSIFRLCVCLENYMNH